MHPVILIAALNVLQYNNYIVSYNDTIGFANYAAAVCNMSSKAAPCRCDRVPYWGPSQNYTCKDYTGTGYDRGHLIPNAEYGMKTCNLANAVPMKPYFNRQLWRMEEEYLRKKYIGLVIFRGCDFGITIDTPTGKLMRIPSGCYWVVTNSTTINYKTGLVDYNYVSMDTYKSSKILPWWVTLEDTTGATMTHFGRYLWIPGTILIIITAAIIVTMYTLAYLRSAPAVFD